MFSGLQSVGLAHPRSPAPPSSPPLPSFLTMDHYTVVRLPPTSADEQSNFKDCMREQFPFMTVRFTFTSEYTYIRFRYPDYATTAAQVTGGDIVETELAPLLIHDVFGDMTLPEPTVCEYCGRRREICDGYDCRCCYDCGTLNCDGNCDGYSTRENPCDNCCREECDGYDCRRCDNCGSMTCQGRSMTCQGRCEDERAYEDEDDDHGPRCRCCGAADDEVGTRYAGYCSYSCAHDDD